MADLETPDTSGPSSASSASSGPAASSGEGGAAGGNGGAGATTSSAGGEGGGSATGSAGAGGGGAGPTPVGGEFIDCQEAGYSGECVGDHLLVYDDNSPACGNRTADQCILNRCAAESKTCGLIPGTTCDERGCLPTVATTFTVCGTQGVAAEGECIDGVAIVPTGPTRCEYKNCKVFAATCMAAPAVPATDCYR